MELSLEESSSSPSESESEDSSVVGCSVVTSSLRACCGDVLDCVEFCVEFLCVVCGSFVFTLLLLFEKL